MRVENGKVMEGRDCYNAITILRQFGWIDWGRSLRNWAWLGTVPMAACCRNRPFPRQPIISGFFLPSVGEVLVA